MRTFLLGGLAIAAAASGSAANAAEFIITFDGTSATFGNGTVTPNPFSDTFTFVLPTEGTLSAGITSSATSALNNLDFTSVTLNGTIPFTLGTLNSLDVAALGPISVAAGTYQLVVNGNSGGNASYGGSLSFSPGAVPEPAGWAMMIAGFGLIGAAYRRQSTRVAFAA